MPNSKPTSKLIGIAEMMTSIWTMPNGDAEHEAQKAVIYWRDLARGRWPELGLLHAIPNGRKRSYIDGKKLKDEGVLPGIPDLFLPVARGDHHGLYIELKRPATNYSKKGAVTKAQKEVMRALEEQGYRCEVAYGSEEAINAIQSYISTER